MKYYLHVDDALDIFAEHGVAGMLGLMANALFSATYIIGLDGVNTGIITGGKCFRIPSFRPGLEP